MKMQAKVQRLRRYTRRSDQYHQNKMFRTDRKKFYRRLNNQCTSINEHPEQQNVEQFWSTIFENEVQHNSDAEWIQLEEDKYDGMNPDEWRDLNVDELEDTIKKSQNWKSPGPDKVTNFWIKHLKSLHSHLSNAINDMIKHPERIPIWLTVGSTILLYKGKEPKNPKQYRPITCLPTTYKIITSVLSNRIYKHLEENNILPIEQKGCRRKAQGCKDQLLISKFITENAKKKKKNLSVAWIDYMKAYDSLPHTWIIKTLEIYKICPTIIDFMKVSMRQWQTEMSLFFEGGVIKTRNIQIKRGIYQGDSLSPLLFCLALIPLTNMLNQERIGYEIERNIRINHLLYMDDLKLFAKNEEEIQRAVDIVKTFSKDVKMSFGLDKCATITIKRGKVVTTENIQVNEEEEIKSLSSEETYKYLGLEERDGIEYDIMKKKIKSEYIRRIRKILKTELSCKNKFEAINNLAVPVLTYSFGVINWLKSEIEQIDRKTRKLLTIGGVHHPKADVDRLYIKRKDGGRGLIEIIGAYETSIIGLNEYIKSTTDQFVEIIKKQDEEKLKYSIHKEAQYILNKYNCQSQHNKQKPLHGQFFRTLDEEHVDKDTSLGWLKNSHLKGETESLLIAAQDQALNTRYHQKKILKQAVDGKCRLCRNADEHISHILSGCTQLASTEYLARHNKVAAYIHWTISKMYELVFDPPPFYNYIPEPVLESRNHLLYWDRTILTDKTVAHNKPDIVYINKQENNAIIIDVAVPLTHNVQKTETEKVTKYEDLKEEMKRIWRLNNIVIIPVVISSEGVTSKNFKINLEKLDIKTYARWNIQKSVILQTCHLVRKFLRN
ncbi:hypothetical protein WDU94_006605 [Cyamophila willieti]